MIDLSAVGLGPHPADPVRPPRDWVEVATSAHTLVKACRVVAGVEELVFGLGLPPEELKRVRPLLLVLEAAVYEWDQRVEDDQRRGAEPSGRQHGDHLLRLLQDIVVVDDGMRDEVDGLCQLFRSETEAVRAADGRTGLFTHVSRFRSADIRLQIRVVSALAGWQGDQLVELLQPCLEVLEVEDDLKTAVEDEESGSFNSFWFLRRSRSAASTRDELDAFAAERARQFEDLLAQTPSELFRQVFVMVCFPRSIAERHVIGALSRLPRPLAHGLVARLVLPRLRSCFTPYWSRPEFQDQAGEMTSAQPASGSDRQR